MTTLTNIRIVLINTSHPGNIGSAARAMKTMGLSKLYLVDPIKFPHHQADELASQATDILKQATVVKTLDEAIGNCHLIFGTSARERTIPWPLLSARESAEKIAEEPDQSEIAIIFGREQSGLTNEELRRCHFHLHIPGNPEYPVLNIASAVQVVAYELRMACLKEKVDSTWDYELADTKAMEGFYEHLERVLVEIEFLNPKAPRQLMTRLRRLFNRARPDVMEMNILRGILGGINNQSRDR